MATLFDCLLHTARALQALHEGTATSTGTTTTLLDSNLTGRGWLDDDFNQGTFFFIKDVSVPTSNLGTRTVTDFTAATGTVTWATAFGVSPALGDVYGIMTKRYPQYIMVQKVNEVLQELGEIVSNAAAAATLTADGTREYSLADTYRIAKILIGDSTASPQDWHDENMWLHRQGRLLFSKDVDSGKSIKVYYYTTHGALLADTDTLDGDINPDWVGVAAAAKAAHWRLYEVGADDKAQAGLVNVLAAREAQLRPMRRAWRPRPATNIFTFAYPEA